MFSEIGQKIKALAKVLCWSGIALSIIVAIALFGLGSNTGLGDLFVLGGMLVLVVGVLFSWLSTFLLFGFGEMIHKVCSIEKKLSGIPQQQNQSEARITRLNALREKNIITEDEYQRAISQSETP